VKREALIALYVALNTPETASDGQVYLSARDLAPLVDTNTTLSFIAKALMSLEEEELVELRMDPNDPNRLATYTLSDDGVLRAEELTGNVDPLYGSRSALRLDEQMIEVDHATDKAVEVSQAMKGLEEQIRTSNDAFEGDPAAREAALAEVKSLSVLWRSGVIRIKAFRERARSALGWIAEKSANAAIGEACKQLMKLILGW
jgi:hypothetical protein